MDLSLGLAMGINTIHLDLQGAELCPLLKSRLHSAVFSLPLPMLPHREGYSGRTEEDVMKVTVEGHSVAFFFMATSGHANPLIGIRRW